MVMFELIGIIIFLIIANHYGKKIPDTGKYSRERQLKKYYETGKIRYLYDRDYDCLLFVFL